MHFPWLAFVLSWCLPRCLLLHLWTLRPEPVVGGPQAPSPVPAWQILLDQQPGGLPALYPVQEPYWAPEVAHRVPTHITLLCPLQGHGAARGDPFQHAGPKEQKMERGELWAVRSPRWSFAAPGAGPGGGAICGGLSFSLSQRSSVFSIWLVWHGPSLCQS